ncbi:MAG: hypothetical protein U1F43_12970 [Myxococcota bacterium]
MGPSRNERRLARALTALALVALAGCNQKPKSAFVSVSVEGNPESLAPILERRVELLRATGSVPMKGPAKTDAKVDRVSIGFDLELPRCDDAVMQRSLDALVGAVSRRAELAIAPAVAPGDAVKAAVAKAVAPAVVQSLVAEALDVPGLAIEKSLPLLAGIALPPDVVLAPERVTDPEGVRLWLVAAKPALTGLRIAHARVDRNDVNQPFVRLELDPEGARILADLTRTATPTLAILFDGRVVSAPRVRGPILDGRASVALGQGTFDEQLRDARALAAAVEDGAMREPLRVADKHAVCVPP